MIADQAFLARKEVMMDENRSRSADRDERPRKGEQLVDDKERNRRKLDEVPEPGTDPLHEGP
ncbi:MAG: hypothetical protein JWN69_1910 [Alphaproteobacteria bacterium]|nr:hypothetical protein [Alphaproteobacteria bacterium]